MPLILIGLFFAVLGLFFVAVPLAVLIYTIVDRRRQKTWTPVVAEIENLSEVTTDSSHGIGSSRRTHSSRSVVARYRYTAPDGSEQTGQSEVGQMKFSVDNPRLDILVDPNNPARSMTSGDTGAGTFGCVTVFAVPFVLVGAFLLWLAFGFFQGP